MKTFYYALFLLLVLGHQCNAQYYGIDRGDIEEVSCEFDSTETISKYSKVRMYSTLNDEWDGSIDSSICYTLNQNGNSWRFTENQADSGRAVFFEPILDSILPLDTSTVYILQPLIYLFDKVIIGLQAPDSTGTDSITTYYELTDPYSDAICFPTQKIDGQYLNKLVFKYTSDGGAQQIYIGYPSIESHWEGTSIIPQLTNQNLNWGPHLVRYWHDIYPTLDSISYTDIMPWGTPTDSTLIQLYVDYSSSLHFQDYTALRGALVDGSDSIRHGLEVILDGNMCIPWIEVFWEGGTHLVANGGSIDFHGSTGCNLFGKGGGLKVKSGNTFRYGRNGIGMMALKTNAQLIIEPGAELIIDGPVFMYEYWDDPTPGQLYMTLPLGSKLTFAEGATLSNQYSLDGTMKLNVYMEGGEIDLSGLSSEEQDLVNLIYASPSSQLSENLTIFPNPTLNNTSVAWVSDKIGDRLIIGLYDFKGKLIVEDAYMTTSLGYNLFKINTDDLNSGIYVVQVTDGNSRKTQTKLLKQ